MTGARSAVTGTAVDPYAGIEPHHIVAIAALVAGVLAQGGFHLTGRVVVGALMAAAATAALIARPWSRNDSRLLALSCTALAGWALTQAVVHGDATAALPTVATIGCLLAGVVVAHRTADRTPLAAAIIGTGLLVAVTGWIGVVWRVTPWAGVVQGLWRAATPITYANAAAAVLTATALLALAWHTSRSRSLTTAVASYLLLVGLAATLSRAALLGLVTGLAVLAVLTGVRATARAAAGPVFGAAIATMTLVPALPAGSAARPGTATAGLLLGLVFTMLFTRPPVGARWPGAVRTGLVAAVLAVPAVIVLSSGAGSAGLRAAVADRVRIESSERSNVWRAAKPMIADHPFAGTGPGHTLFGWVDAAGRPGIAQYAHNEYLQILVDLGAVGLVLLLLLLCALARYVLRGRAGAQARVQADIRAGAIAGLVALTVHSGFDFLWQLPVIPLLAGLLAGLAGPTSAPGDRPAAAGSIQQTLEGVS